MPDFAALLVGMILVALPAYVLGWASGVGTARNRNRKMVEALENYAKKIEEFSGQGDDTYWRGYASGVESTIKAMYTFLSTFTGDDDGPPSND